jgi:GNAT superfamily N-acetyltransferase
MEIKKKQIESQGIKLFIEQDGREVARAFLYILRNDFRNRIFGYMEDVFVAESMRGQGLGTIIINELIKTAKEIGCYKIISTSRHGRGKVHALYERLGFKNFGIEFKMYLEEID